jgi:hypothetical protein
VAPHDKAAPDKSFLALLPLIEKGARDERNFVKKGVSWALRAIGRRNATLNPAAIKVARRLADSPQAAARWAGNDALRELTSPAVTRRSKREKRTPMTNVGTLQLIALTNSGALPFPGSSRYCPQIRLGARGAAESFDKLAELLEKA